jgi:carbon starvation protein
VMIASDAALAGKGPGLVYAHGLGLYLSAIVGEENRVFATTFAAMAFSTFVFDTLDVSTRLGRYILQELMERTSRATAIGATALTVLVPLAWLMAAGEGAYRQFWVLFGTSNQLLAALSLLGISVWLRRTGRRSAFAWVPMLFVMAITVWSLVAQVAAVVRSSAASGWKRDTPTLNGVVCVLLMVLVAVLVREAVRAVRAIPTSGPRADTG